MTGPRPTTGIMFQDSTLLPWKTVMENVLFPARAGVEADNVLFLGTVDIGRFSYDEIHELGDRTLSVVAEVVPDAREIALTVHGPGFGLDEIACFDSQISGFLAAAARGDVPRELKRISLVESNPRRAQRLLGRLSERVPGELLFVDEPGSPAGRAPRGPADVTPTAPRRHAFVAMPFAAEFDDVFDYGITNAVHHAGLLCERIDKQPFTGDVLDRMKEKIRSAELVVADVTGANANVLLEVGYAWGRGVPTVLVCRQGSDLPFDIRGQRCLMYASIKDLETKLSSELAALRPIGG